MEQKIHNTLVELIQGDITELNTDAIVNAANTHLQHRGGVAGAIVRKGGDIIQHQSTRIGKVPVGHAAITCAGKLKCKYVIHAVGPQMGEGDEDSKLKNATLNSLKLADTHRLRSIAFCAISTGIFGYPMDRCAKIMLETTHQYLAGSTNLNRVVFCLYDDTAFNTFLEEMKKIS